MTWFPQLSTGCLVQLPLSRRLVWRAITNRLENGERISLPDTPAGRIEWNLAYKELSEGEAAGMGSFFRNCRGAFGTFSFADPSANLLGWSEDLSRPDWQHGLLSVVPNRAAPNGTLSASTLINAVGAAQQLTQTVALPGQYTTCFSAWLRSDSPATVTLRRGSAVQPLAITSNWKRYYLTGAVPGEDNAPFSVELQPGQSMDVWGFQVEAGPYPSQYVPVTTASGIYERTSFAADELAITATGVGLFATEFTLISRL